MRGTADADLPVGARTSALRRAGAGRPILLIHGFTNYGLAWAPQLAALVHAGYRVILPDLHGHGASTPATRLVHRRRPCSGYGRAARSPRRRLARRLRPLARRDGRAGAGARATGSRRRRRSGEQPLVVRRPRNDRAWSTAGPLCCCRKTAAVRLRATWPMLVNEPFRESAERPCRVRGMGAGLRDVPRIVALPRGAGYEPIRPAQTPVAIRARSW